MQVSTFLVRFRAVPLRHKIIAAGVAVAIAGGGYVLSKRGVTKSATAALLSFNPGVARQIEPRVLDAKEPAVALAQSILSDDVVKAVSKQAGVSFSAAKNDVTEFRSRLEITQPSAKTLWVSYHDADQKKSATAVNTVAIILAAWTPFPVVEPPPVAVENQAASPVGAPESNGRRHHASPPPSNSLRELEAQLSASDQKLASLSAEQAIVLHKANADLQPSNAESEHRRLLQVQLSAAEKRLADLRVRYTDEYPDVETTKENIAEIQQELASVPPVSNEPLLIANPKAGDTIAAEIGQRRQDRLRLMQAIITEERREAILREDATPSGQGRGATVQTVSLSQPQQSPIPVSVNPPDHLLENPFRLVRLATLNRSNLWWPVPLTGFLCGLLYLGIATWRYQPIESVNPGAPGAMRTVDNALTFQESPSTGILSENKSGGLERVPFIVESDTSVDRDKAPLIHSPEAAPNLVNASEGEDPQGKWERAVREALAQTSIGRQFETLNRNDDALVRDNQKQVSSEGPGAQEQPSRYLKDFDEVVRDNIRDPDIWIPHSEAARDALAANDLDTAIREIKLAIAVAPGKLKTWLGNFLGQLENDRRRLPEANHGEFHCGEAAESVIASAIAKPVVRVNVKGHPILGRFTGPQDDA